MPEEKPLEEILKKLRIEETMSIEEIQKTLKLYSDGFNEAHFTDIKFKSIDEAITFYEVALRKESNPKMMYNLAMIYHQKREFEKALDLFTKVLDMNPEDKMLRGLNGIQFVLTSLEFGKQLMGEEKYEEAKKHLSNAITKEKLLPDPYIRLGLIYEKEKNYELAFANLSEAIKLYPEGTKPLLSKLASICFYLGEKLKFFHNFAIKFGLEALQHDPTNESTLLAVAGSYLNTNQIDKAEYYFLEALKLWPENSFANNHMGKVRMYKKDYLNAIEFFKKSLEAEVKFIDDEENLLSISDAYLLLHKFDESFKYTQKALKINPNNARAHYFSSVYHYAKKEFGKAIQHSKKVIDSEHPNFIDLLKSHYMIGLNTKPEEAIVHFEKVLEKISNLEEEEQKGLKQNLDEVVIRTHGKLAEYYMVMGENEKAKTHYIKLIEITPLNERNYWILAQLYQDEGDLDKALEVGKQAIESNLSSVPLFLTLGMVYHRKKEFQNAVDFYNKALELDFSDIIVHTHIARSYIEVGNLDKAKEHSEFALENNKSPENQIHVYSTLIQLYRALGDKEEEKRYMNKFDELENAKKKTT